MNERVVTELVIDARNSTAGAAEFERAMAKASAAAEQQSTINGKLPTSLDRITAAYKRIEASIDPITKAQHLHEREMIRSQNAINRAVMAGVTTEQDAARVISSLRAKQIAEIASLRSAQAGAVGIGRAGAGATSFNSGNVAAQLQDIAITSAMGQSALTIALQQGTQLSAVFGQTGAAGAVATLRAALGSLISPVSLITIALTGAAAIAIKYFMEWTSQADDSEETLKKQQELIAGVAAKWGETLPALKAYNDELTKQKDLSDALEATTAARSQQYVEERSRVVDLTIDLDDLINKLQMLGGDPTQIVELQTAFANLQAKVKDSTATAADALAVQKELNDLMGTGLPIVGEYANMFGDLASQIGKAAAAAEKFDVVQRGGSLFSRDGLESILSPLDPLNGFNRTPFQSEEDIMFARSRASSVPVGATGTMTTENGVNVSRYMSAVADYTEESAGYLDDISTGMPGYFDNLEETLKNDVTGSITRYLQQLIYAQELAAMSISDAVRTGFITGNDARDRDQYTISRNDPLQDYFAQRFGLQSEANAAAGKSVTSPIGGQSSLMDYYLGGATKGVSYAGKFAEGGSFTVPGQSSGDRTLVALHANGGETVSVKRKDEYGGGSKTIHLHYTPAPGDSDATSAQRMRTMVGAGLQELARV
jgi:hypothetical protein